MADIKAIAEELVNLTVKEVNELATVLKDQVLLSSRSLRPLRRLVALVLRKLRISLTVLPLPLRRVFPRKRLRTSRRPSRLLVPRLS